MTGYSERSQELAEQLLAKATRNLERSGKVVSRSASGKFVTKGDTQWHPSTVSERGGSRGGRAKGQAAR